MENSHSSGFFRAAALTALLTGAAGSLYFVIVAGKNNHSILLPALFTIWVLSPFVVLAIFNTVSKSWPLSKSKMLYCLMFIIAFGSLIFYAVFNGPGIKRTFIFLINPLLSWVLIIIAVMVKRKSGRRNNA